MKDYSEHGTPSIRKTNICFIQIYKITKHLLVILKKILLVSVFQCFSAQIDPKLEIRSFPELKTLPAIFHLNFSILKIYQAVSISIHIKLIRHFFISHGT